MDMGMIAGLLGKMGGGAGGGGGSGGGSGWGAPGTLPPNFPGVPNIAPQPTSQPAAPQRPPDPGMQPQQGSNLMQPRQNAGGDFWGPVVQLMLKRYLEQQRAGGSMSGMGNLGSPGRGGEPPPMM